MRRKGYSNEVAKDITQGFFYEVVLGRGLIQLADNAQGRFRTFLLTALDRYITNVYHKETARKCRPDGQIVPLETDDVANLLVTQSENDPENIFHYVWASEVLDQVLATVKKECCNSQKEIHWKIFSSKVVAPIVDGGEIPRLSMLCERYGIESEAKASNMIVPPSFQSIITLIGI